MGKSSNTPRIINTRPQANGFGAGLGFAGNLTDAMFTLFNQYLI
jgi:hypothetical protein